MWSRIPASPAPEHRLCTAAVEESGSSLWPGLPCVYCGRGHGAPRLGSGSYKGQSWWRSLLGVERETTAWMALWVGPETLAYSHPAQNTSPCRAPGLWWHLGWNAASWWHLQMVVWRTEQWGQGREPGRLVSVQSAARWDEKRHSTWAWTPRRWGNCWKWRRVLVQQRRQWWEETGRGTIKHWEQRSPPGSPGNRWKADTWNQKHDTRWEEMNQTEWNLFSTVPIFRYFFFLLLYNSTPWHFGGKSWMFFFVARQSVRPYCPLHCAHMMPRGRVSRFLSLDETERQGDVLELHHPPNRDFSHFQG